MSSQPARDHLPRRGLRLGDFLETFPQNALSARGGLNSTRFRVDFLDPDACSRGGDMERTEDLGECIEIVLHPEGAVEGEKRGPQGG